MPSGERHSTYYLSVPDSWATIPPAELKAKVMGVFRDIYDAFNAHFRAVEPNDLVADISRMQALLNFTPQVTREKGIGELTRHYLNLAGQSG